MSRFSFPGLGLLIASLMILLPHAGALPLVLLGEDPAEDSVNHLFPGVSGSALGGTERTDILAVHMGMDDKALYVNMTLREGPGGTGGYMYHVDYVRDGKQEFVCYAVQYAGGVRVNEGALGCARFDGQPRGPSTLSNGVTTGETTWGDEDAFFIQWPIDLVTLIDPVTSIQNISADSWFRGVSTCCTGSSQSAEYLWNLADRAPDDEEATWAFTPGGSADDEPLNLTVSATPPEQTVEAGEAALYELVLALNGTLDENETVTFDLDVEGLDNWDWSLEPQEIVFNETSENVSATLNVTVPSDREPGTTDFNTTACQRNATTCANLTLVLVVEPAPLPTGNATAGPTPPARTNTTTNTTNGSFARQDDGAAQSKDSPGAGIALFLVAAAALVATVRRRRR